MGILKGHRLAVLIAALHLVLGGLYSVAVPLWEAYDEWGHYPYMRYIAIARALPPKGGPIVVENDTARGQPPLYYILGAASTFWIDTSDFREPTRNHYSSLATAMGGYNRALHGYGEDFPWHGSVLAAHVARFLSVVLSTITVWFVYLIGRTLFPLRRAVPLGAMAIAAFWPQFLFIGSVINNDNLINCAATILLWLMVRNVILPARWWDQVALVASLVLAIASKAIGVVFTPLVLLGLAVSFLCRRRHADRRWIVPIVLGLLVAVFAAGVLFVSQHPRYVERLQFFLNPRALSRMSPARWLGILQVMWGTLWASFGWQSVGIDAWVYRVVEPVWLAAVAGLIWFLARSRDRLVKLALIGLGASVAIVTIATLYRGLFSSYYWTGRYLLGTIGAISTLLAVGLAHLGPRRVGNAIVAAVGVAMFAFAVWSPLAYIIPVYARPSKLPESVVGALPNPVHVNFGGTIELLGYDVEPPSFSPGQTVRVTLYWRCLKETETDYTLALKLLGQGDAEYAGLNVHPGRGNYPTSMWRAGDVFHDSYWIPVPADVPAPAMARLKVAFFRTESALPPLQRLKVANDPTIMEHLPAFDPLGQPLGFAAILGRYRLFADGQEALRPVHGADYRLGETIRLVGYDLPRRVTAGGQLALRLLWQSEGMATGPYTVFVHVLDAAGNLVAQADGQPMGGEYPTDLWGEGDRVLDEHAVPLPVELEPGEYQLAVGMYSAESQARLVVTDPEGGPVPDNQIVLGAIRLDR